MIRRVSWVSLITSHPPLDKRTGSRPNPPLSLSASRHMRLRRLLILLLPLTLLMSGPARSQSTVSLFSNLVPATPVDPYTGPTTNGVKFWSSQAGTISAIRFYRAATSRLGYSVMLYSADGKTLLGYVKMKTESGPVPGWQQADFATPIPIKANTTYVAANYAPTGQYADTQHALRQTVTSGPLNAPAAPLVGGNGVWVRNRGFPHYTWNSSNFFVDVVFLPAGSRYLSIALTPANPTIPSTAPLGTVVAKITVTWSDGSPFTGTLSFGLPNSNGGGVYAIDSNNNLIIDPAGSGVGASGGSVQNVTIVATQ